MFGTEVARHRPLSIYQPLAFHILIFSRSTEGIETILG
jgi:hypothetical protein